MTEINSISAGCTVTLRVSPDEWYIHSIEPMAGEQFMVLINNNTGEKLEIPVSKSIQLIEKVVSRLK